MEMTGTTVTIPLTYFNELAACYYGTGPSKYEKEANKRRFTTTSAMEAQGFGPGISPPSQLDGDTETNHVRETLPQAVIDKIGGLPGRQGFQPAGILAKRLKEAEERIIAKATS